MQDIRKFLKRKAPDDSAPSRNPSSPGLTSADNVPTVDPVQLPVQLPPALRRKGHSNDIGNFVGKTLTQDERYRCLVNTWTPDKDFIFEPVMQSNRLRWPQLQWLEKYKNVAFSAIEQGFFCKPCTAFADVPLTLKNWRNVPKLFISVPYRRYKNFLEDYTNHSNTKYHKHLLEMSLDFRTNFDRSIDVHSLHISGHQREVEENRKQVKLLANVMLFIGKYELPFRGRLDHGRISEKADSSHGVFKGMISFLVSQGVKDTEILLTCPKNAMYTSPQIQNEMLSCIASVLLDPVVKRIQETKMITLMVDESSCHSTEYLAIVLRTVDAGNDINEDFIGFIQLEDTSANAVLNAIDTRFTQLGLSLKWIVGQGYDGAKNLSGIYAGLQALIREFSPEGLYFHCVVHRINLVATNAVKAFHPDVNAALGHFSHMITYFHKSPKAAAKLRNVADRLENITTKRRHIPSLCDTRFVERHESLIGFKLLMPAVIVTLSELADEGDAKADGHRTILESQFRVYPVLIVIEDISKILKRPAELLQCAQTELIYAMELINDVVEVLESRVEGSNFEDLYQQALDLAQSCECPIVVKKGRITLTEPDEVKSHFQELFKSVYELVLIEMKRRFGKTQSDVVVGLLSVVPGIEGGDKQKIQVAAEHYRRFLPSPDLLSVELETWERHVAKSESKPNTFVKTLKFYKGLQSSHPNIHRLLQIGATLPVSTCTVERSFSALSRILSDVRASMKVYRLSDLALISYYADTDEPDYDEIVNKFKLLKSRRIAL